MMRSALLILISFPSARTFRKKVPAMFRSTLTEQIRQRLFQRRETELETIA